MFSRLEERTGFLEAVSGQHANTYAPQPEQERSYVENARCCGFGGFCPNEPRGGGGLSLPRLPIDSDFCPGVVIRKCIARPCLQWGCLQKPASRSNIDSSVSAYKQI